MDRISLQFLESEVVRATLSPRDEDEESFAEMCTKPDIRREAERYDMSVQQYVLFLDLINQKV